MGLYKKVSIFRRIENGLKIYNCFHDVGANTYFVQSADFYRSGDDFWEKKKFFDRQLVDLFIEDDVSERGDGYNSIEEAIQKFDEEFA